MTVLRGETIPRPHRPASENLEHCLEQRVKVVIFVQRWGRKEEWRGIKPEKGNKLG